MRTEQELKDMIAMYRVLLIDMKKECLQMGTIRAQDLIPVYDGLENLTIELESIKKVA